MVVAADLELAMRKHEGLSYFVSHTDSDFRDFPQFKQVNAGMIPRKRLYRLSKSWKSGPSRYAILRKCF